MRKTLFGILFIYLTNLAFGQWNVNSSNLYYSGGKVGIGTASPDKLLTLASGSNVYMRIAKSQYSDFFDLGVTSHFADISYTAGTSTDSNMRFLTNNNTRMYIQHDGDVGIGTSSPSEKLDVNGNFALSKTSPYLYWNGNTLNLKSKSDVIPVVSVHGSTSYSSRFDMWNAGDNQNTVRLHSGSTSWINGGKVGIGTTTPGAKLEVFGTTGLRIKSSTHADSFMDLRGSVNVSSLNPGATTSASIISGRPNGHLVIDISANDINDSFAVRTDQNTDGTVDHLAMVIKASGDMGIGTSSPSEKLEVAGNALIDGEIYSKKVKVSTDPGNWPDYVFEPSYKLQSLNELEKYIQANKHLPEVPSAIEVKEKGQDLGEIQATLLKKVEELTLYMIEQNKKQESLKDRLNNLEQENIQLKKELKQLRK